mmetsp:Transcript_10459/g.27697  ORF Transcript_10459/g.27697 Transcript_10459/m.27697 type:complete len:241 (-) Transcript_10459:1426-2148(-)
MKALACSILVTLNPETAMAPSSPTSRPCSSKSSMMARIVFPPGPITLPMDETGTARLIILGTVDGSSVRGPGSAACICSRICKRPCLACSSARSSVSTARPSHLMSSWKVEMPLSSPATLKSMVPSPSSMPRMSVSTRGSSSPPSSSRIRPIATPAITLDMGTPASIRASDPPHTLAMDDEPDDSVISDSTRIEYGNSFSFGTPGTSARSARFPWPTSRRPGAPVRPTSPTEQGGNEYWR